MKQSSAGTPCQKGPDPRNKIVINTPRAQGAVEDVGINIVKTGLDVKEQCRDLERRTLELADHVRESSASVKGRKRGEGATLIVVEEANISGDGGEAGGDDPFQDLRNGLKEDYDTE